MEKTTRAWRHLGRTSAIAASFALLLASGGSASDGARTLTVDGARELVSAKASELIGSLPAGQVGASATALAQAAERAGFGLPANGQARTTASENATANASTNARGLSATRPTANDGTVGARPGWGCGDVNHTHSGPPGRPDATPPPGCDR